VKPLGNFVEEDYDELSDGLLYKTTVHDDDIIMMYVVICMVYIWVYGVDRQRTYVLSLSLSFVPVSPIQCLSLCVSIMLCYHGPNDAVEVCVLWCTYLLTYLLKLTLLRAIILRVLIITLSLHYVAIITKQPHKPEPTTTTQSLTYTHEPKKRYLRSYFFRLLSRA